MALRGRGTISAGTSLAGMRGLPSSAAYSASKAAVSTFLESVRIELAPCGVAVVDIRPGFVDTPLTRKNKFKMPFLMDVDDAAEAAVRGLERGDAVVAFPWQLSSAMTLAEKMPDALWRTIAVRVTPDRS
jgi:short-subunit dehydrogenase